MDRVAIALGSNVGDRRAHLDYAVSALRALLGNVTVSRYYDTVPVGGSVRSPRTLDLDLILLGEVVLEEPGLVVPHPRFRERRFVLEPLAAVAPELRDPVSGETVSSLLSRLGAS